MSAQPITTAEVPLPVRIEALEKLLAAQLDEYRKLLELVNRKSQAIREAHTEAIPEIFEREKAVLQRIGEAERGRIELIRAISAVIRPGEQKPLRVTEIAEAHPAEESRTRLLAIAEQLRQVATEVRSRSSKVRAAAEALARHMTGVMQNVRSALSRAGVYENKGRLAMGAQLDFSVDIRS